MNCCFSKPNSNHNLTPHKNAHQWVRHNGVRELQEQQGIMESIIIEKEFSNYILHQTEKLSPYIRGVVT